MHDLHQLRVFAFYFQVLQKVCVCVCGGRVGQDEEEESKQRRNPRDTLHVKIIPPESFLTLFFIFFPVRCKKKEKKNLSRKQKPQYIIHQFGSCPCIFWKKSFFFLHVQIILILEVLRSDLRNRKFSGAQKLTWREERFFFFFKTFLKEWTSLHPEEKKTGILIYIYIYLYIFIECNFKVTLTPLSSGFRNVLLLLTLP